MVADRHALAILFYYYHFFTLSLTAATPLSCAHAPARAHHCHDFTVTIVYIFRTLLRTPAHTTAPHARTLTHGPTRAARVSPAAHLLAIVTWTHVLYISHIHDAHSPRAFYRIYTHASNALPPLASATRIRFASLCCVVQDVHISIFCRTGTRGWTRLLPHAPYVTHGVLRIATR